MQPLVVAVEVLRQLPQHRAQAAGIEQRLERLVEAGDPFLDSDQPLYVRQVAAGLDREHEVLRRLPDPSRDGLATLQPVEGRVDLDCVELPRVQLEPAALGLPLGVKAPPPIIVHPSRAADAYAVHGEGRTFYVVSAAVKQSRVERPPPPVPPRPTEAKLREAVQGCRACDLWEGATQGVMGEGAARASLM